MCHIAWASFKRLCTTLNSREKSIPILFVCRLHSKWHEENSQCVIKAENKATWMIKIRLQYNQQTYLYLPRLYSLLCMIPAVAWRILLLYGTCSLREGLLLPMTARILLVRSCQVSDDDIWGELITSLLHRFKGTSWNRLYSRQPRVISSKDMLKAKLLNFDYFFYIVKKIIQLLPLEPQTRLHSQVQKNKK